MSSEIYSDRINIIRKIHISSTQEIPVLETSPVYILFLSRKEASIKYLSKNISEEQQEELILYIDYCNEQIKKYLGL